MGYTLGILLLYVFAFAKDGRARCGGQPDPAGCLPRPGEGSDGEGSTSMRGSGWGNRCYTTAGRVAEHPMTNETNYIAKSIIDEN